MAHRHFAAFGQAVHHLRGKHFVYQAKIPIACDHTVHIDGNAAAFLPAVLQSIQRIVNGAGHVGFAGMVINAEYAALFMQAVIDLVHTFSFSILLCKRREEKRKTEEPVKKQAKPKAALRAYFRLENRPIMPTSARNLPGISPAGASSLPDKPLPHRPDRGGTGPCPGERRWWRPRSGRYQG